MQFKLIYLARRNPSVRAEDWPRTWRSHAVFVSQFPAVYARFTGVLYCSRVLEPTLDGVPFEPPTARDYDGVALVSGPEPEGLRTNPPPELRARIDQDELRVFSTHTPNFSFLAEEVLVHGGAAGQAAVIRFLARKPGSSSESFFATWNQDYARSATRAADASGKVTRYVHDRPIEKPPPGYPFDGVTETWFASTDDAVRSFADAALAPLSRDLPAFCDLERCVALLTSVTHRWPRV
jgi:hypothetical protein